MTMYLTIFGKPRYLGLAVTAEGESLSTGELVLIESSRGVEVAQVAGEISEAQEALYRSIDNRQEGPVSGDLGLQPVIFLEKANLDHMVQEERNRKDEEQALVVSRQILSHHSLDMKLVDVEYLNDRKKLFFYFTSAQRVDFRAYVRDLAREFHTRIELRQIGARDEAKVVRGLGPCGRPCCCSYWLQRFAPIGIRMVKEQNLALNPSKISGLCGRLMCCMNFEQHSYRDLWSNLPSQGSKIRTDQGTYVLLGVDLASRTCQIRGPESAYQIPVELFGTFKEAVLAGKSWSNEDYGLDEKGSPLSQQSRCNGRFCDGNCRSCGEGCSISALWQQSPEIPQELAQEASSEGPRRKRRKRPSQAEASGEAAPAAQRRRTAEAQGDGTGAPGSRRAEAPPERRGARAQDRPPRPGRPTKPSGNQSRHQGEQQESPQAERAHPRSRRRPPRKREVSPSPQAEES